MMLDSCFKYLHHLKKQQRQNNVPKGMPIRLCDDDIMRIVLK